MIWLLLCLSFPLSGSSTSSQTSLAYFSFPTQLEGSGLAFSDYQYRLINYYGNITVINVSIVTSRTALTFDTNGFYYPEHSRDKLYNMIFELEKNSLIAVKGIDWVDNDLIAYTQPPEELIDHLDKTLARYGFIPIMKDKSENQWKNYTASSRFTALHFL
ncbi:hypothetical protein PRIPAC_91597 [Pristionchus pacificus]|uniref:Uncharacterized protein n=1 Tax=Pristionchus pacificus TaxID=54126 RepID=A0A2A6BQX6_PRIPA|nr:hypothetical protein PRIPAC_91597 [Pristionchus pacificus]|eukprot:PDM68324.1 hypothetical protein PRIPAC_46368 [Pristionchus pacificus]